MKWESPPKTKINKILQISIYNLEILWECKKLCHYYMNSMAEQIKLEILWSSSQRENPCTSNDDVKCVAFKLNYLPLESLDSNYIPSCTSAYDA